MSSDANGRGIGRRGGHPAHCDEGNRTQRDCRRQNFCVSHNQYPFFNAELMTVFVNVLTFHIFNFLLLFGVL